MKRVVTSGKYIRKAAARDVDSAYPEGWSRSQTSRRPSMVRSGS